MLLLVIYKETAEDECKYNPSDQRRQYINKVLYYTKFVFCSKNEKEDYNKSQKLKQCIWFQAFPVKYIATCTLSFNFNLAVYVNAEFAHFNIVQFLLTILYVEGKFSVF